MGRFRRRLETLQDEQNNPDERYQMAYERVKRIKGFYTHLLVYILVNAFIIIANTNRNTIGSSEFWNWETFSTALFWGIGLVAHGVSVFGHNIFFGMGWQERKIKEFMEEESNQKWQ